MSVVRLKAMGIIKLLGFMDRVQFWGSGSNGAVLVSQRVGADGSQYCKHSPAGNVCCKEAKSIRSLWDLQ